MPLLAAAYGALQGTDGIFFFASDGAGWAQHLDEVLDLRPGGRRAVPGHGAGVSHGPHPDRRGEPPPRGQAVQSVCAQGGGARFASIRSPTSPAGSSSISPSRGGRHRAGPTCRRSSIGGPGRCAALTGELNWDYGRGLVTVDAPSAQGATGFLSRAGTIKLGVLTIQSPLEYGAILLVALDGRPLAVSHKMLLQVMSEENNFGWSAPGQGLRQLLDVGGPPIVVKRLAGTLAIDRPDAAALEGPTARLERLPGVGGRRTWAADG